MLPSVKDAGKSFSTPTRRSGLCAFLPFPCDRILFPPQILSIDNLEFFSLPSTLFPPFQLTTPHTDGSFPYFLFFTAVPFPPFRRRYEWVWLYLNMEMDSCSRVGLLFLTFDLNDLDYIFLEVGTSILFGLPSSGPFSNPFLKTSEFSPLSSRFLATPIFKPPLPIGTLLW